MTKVDQDDIGVSLDPVSREVGVVVDDSPCPIVVEGDRGQRWYVPSVMLRASLGARVERLEYESGRVEWNVREASDPKDGGGLRDDTTPPEVDLGPQRAAPKIARQIEAEVKQIKQTIKGLSEVVVGPLSQPIRDAIDDARVAQLLALGGPLEGD